MWWLSQERWCLWSPLVEIQGFSRCCFIEPLQLQRSWCTWMATFIWMDTARKYLKIVLGETVRRSKDSSWSLWTRVWVLVQMPRSLCGPHRNILNDVHHTKKDGQHVLWVWVATQAFSRCIITMQMVFPPFQVIIHICLKDVGISGTWNVWNPAWWVALGWLNTCVGTSLATSSALTMPCGSFQNASTWEKRTSYGLGYSLPMSWWEPATHIMAKSERGTALRNVYKSRIIQINVTETINASYANYCTSLWQKPLCRCQHQLCAPRRRQRWRRLKSTAIFWMFVEKKWCPFLRFRLH